MFVSDDAMTKLLGKLQAAIDASGLTQAQVSRKSGVATGALSMFLSGQRKLRFEQVALIARALGVSLDYLADDAADEPPRPPGEAERWAADFIHVKGLNKRQVIERLTSDPTAPPEIVVEGASKKRNRRA